MSQTAFWDTNLFIYLFDKTCPQHSSIQTLLAWQRNKQITPFTSTLTLAELLVQPLALGRKDLVVRYTDILTELGCHAFGKNEAIRFAEIRAHHPRLKPPDCIQLACAAVRGADFFITNDRRLSPLQIDGIGQLVALGDQEG